MPYLAGVLAIFIALFTTQYYRVANERDALLQENIQIKTLLKSAQNQNVEDFEYIKKLESRKLQIIKKIEYKNETCEVELESYKNLINSFN